MKCGNRYNKMNILDWCKYCDQGWVKIVKNIVNGKLYCECDEDYSLWATPEDYENGANCIKENRFFYKCCGEDPFILASDEEIIRQGWNQPDNTVCACSVCFNNIQKNDEYPLITASLVQRGLVVIKKNKDTGKLFCLCETCGYIWEDIRDVVKKVVISSSNIKIDHYEDATREEIIAAGWDKYDDIYCIKE